MSRPTKEEIERIRITTVAHLRAYPNCDACPELLALLSEIDALRAEVEKKK